jgi:hypothetical protein
VGVVTCAVAITGGLACSIAKRPAALLSAASANAWTGLWVLEVDGFPKGELSLSVKDVDGRIAATLHQGVGRSIEITKISSTGTDLVLAYEQPDRSGKPDTVVSTLSVLPDGTVRVRSIVDMEMHIGTGRKVSVSEKFLDELLREFDLEEKFRKARAAGLIVKQYGFDADKSTTFHEIVDPASGAVVLSGRVTVD